MINCILILKIFKKVFTTMKMKKLTVNKLMKRLKKKEKFSKKLKTGLNKFNHAIMIMFK